MKKILKSTLTATLILMVAIGTQANLVRGAIATPTAPVTATKQTQRGVRRVHENYYTNNYERAINRGFIRRPSRVQNENRALELAYEALERGRRDEAARRFAQALVAIEDKNGTTAAAFFEQRLNRVLRAEWGQTLNDLPIFNRIFPIQSTTNNTPYRQNYERAIDRGTIRRPSRVSNINQALNLAYIAIERENNHEAARRIAQALVMIEERNGTNAAFTFEQELNAEIEENFGIPLREYLPLLAIIFRGDRYR